MLHDPIQSASEGKEATTALLELDDLEANPAQLELHSGKRPPSIVLDVAFAVVEREGEYQVPARRHYALDLHKNGLAIRNVLNDVETGNPSRTAVGKWHPGSVAHHIGNVRRSDVESQVIRDPKVSLDVQAIGRRTRTDINAKRAMRIARFCEQGIPQSRDKTLGNKSDRICHPYIATRQFQQPQGHERQLINVAQRRKACRPSQSTGTGEHISRMRRRTSAPG